MLEHTDLFAVCGTYIHGVVAMDEPTRMVTCLACVLRMYEVEKFGWRLLYR